MRLVTRAQWGARAPRRRVALSPTFGSTVHYEGPHLGAFPHTSCPAKVRGIQAFHMDSRGWDDLAYTALVCPHGYTFEGRWAGVRTAANGTNDGNRTAYAVCVLIGEGDAFTAEAEAEVVDVLDVLDRMGGAGPGVNQHGDWKPTACAGAAIRAAMPRIRAALEARRNPPPPVRKVNPMFDPPVLTVAALVDPKSGGAWLLAPDGAIYAVGGAPYLGGMNDAKNRADFAGRKAARLEAFGSGYRIVAESGEKYVPKR